MATYDQIPETATDYDATATTDVIGEYRPATTSHGRENETTWEKQQVVLAGYADKGVIAHGARLAGVHRRTVYNWLESDTLGFKARLADARQDYSDSLETMAHDYASELKAGQNPTMILGLLNANLPEKWKRNATEDNPAREIMVELRKSIREAAREAKALQAGETVEGEYREVVVGDGGGG